MRTSIMLDQAILGSLLKETGLKSKSKAARLAIEDYLRRKRLAKVLSLRGTYTFSRKSSSWRRLER